MPSFGSGILTRSANSDASHPKFHRQGTDEKQCCYHVKMQSSMKKCGYTEFILKHVLKLYNFCMFYMTVKYVKKITFKKAHKLFL